MTEVLNEIKKLRGDNTLHIDRANKNPFRLLLNEEDGSCTAYYFSVPIYNLRTRRLLRPCFVTTQGGYAFNGSTAEITVSGNVLYCRSKSAACHIVFDGGLFRENSGVLQNDLFSLSATLNGVACCGRQDEDVTAKFVLHMETPFMSIRSNGRCFSPMSSEFQPSVTVSGIAELDSFGRAVAPLDILFRNLSEKDYEIEFSANSPYCQKVLFEINMHISKLFQDTTVNSLQADTNNAFGGVAYIGNTVCFGEEWLYTRLDYEYMKEMIGREVRRVVFHLPIWDNCPVRLSAFSVASRFCSFGSTWNNKMQDAYKIGDSTIENGYHHVDLSDYLIERRTGALQHREGMVLRSKEKGSGYTIVSTGDSFFAPQVLELNYR